MILSIWLGTPTPRGITSFDNNGVSTGETFDLAGGNATITPDGTNLNFVTFTPAPLFNFTSFTTRGQLLAAGNVFITVNDNFGQTFTFMEAKDQNWTGGIGVEAIQGTGETIASVTVWTDGSGFKEVKQQTFGFEDAPSIAAAPGPGGAGIPGLALIGLTLLGIDRCGGGTGLRKRKRNKRIGRPLAYPPAAARSPVSAANSKPGSLSPSPPTQ